MRVNPRSKMSAPMVNMRSPEDSFRQEKMDEEVAVSVCAGSNMIRSKTIFSPDSKFIFCCTETTVRVYSCSSGECVRNLHGHTAVVTGLLLNPHNKLQVLSCALDQTLIFWDYTDGILLKRVRLPCPLYGLLSLGQHSHSLMVLQKTKKDACDIVRYESLLSAKTSNVKSLKSSVEIAAVGKEAKCVAVGCRGEFVAAVHGSALKMTLLKDEEHKQKRYTVERGLHLTCIACHPNEYCIATGVSNGMILLWRSFMKSNRTVVKTTYHWHSLPVLDLTFTPEGSYLLSGGHECVLVKWQPNSEHKTFLPRLGAPLCHIAVSQDNCMYATSHHDNVIHLISSNMQLLNVYQGLTKAHLGSQLKNLYPMGLICDPRSKALVLNGKPGHIQMYSVQNDCQLYNLDIVGHNYISPDNLKCPLVVTEVTKSAFDTSGLWLATIEEWNDGVMSPESRLKFWYYDKQNREYTLNTVVEVPHNKSVACLRFRPSCQDNSQHFLPMVVTSSSDKKFKIWTNMDDTDIYRVNTKWTCESVGYYRGRPAGSCRFAVDGSLLAVVFEYTVTLWDPENNVLKQTLVHQSGGLKHIKHIEFGNKSCSHLLVSTTQAFMTVWNLMSCTVSWTVDLDVTCLIPDPLNDVMAVCCSDNNLFVFLPSNPSPVYSQEQISDSDVICGVFIPHLKETYFSKDRQLNWQSQSQLYLMNKQQDLLTVTHKVQDKIEITQQLKLQQNLPQTPFSLLLDSNKKQGFTGYKEVMGDNSVYKSAAEITRELLNTPSHGLPPVTLLCQNFVQNLLITRKGEEKSEESDIEDDKSDNEDVTTADSDMEVDKDHTDNTQSVTVANVQEVQHSVRDSSEDNLKFENLDWYKDLLQS